MNKATTKMNELTIIPQKKNVKMPLSGKNRINQAIFSYC